MEHTTASEQQVAELSLLSNLGKSFSAVLDLSELLTQVIDAAVILTYACEGALILKDPETRQITIQAVRTPADSTARTLEQPVDDPLAEHVIDQTSSLLISPGDDLAEVADIEQVERALLYVPLVSKGRTIGVLRVQDKAGEEVFSRHDEDLLTGLAGYAAIAIENALLYKQAVDTTLGLMLLVESANALSWSLDLEPVLDGITHYMMRGLHTHWCIISSWDVERDRICRLAERRRALWPPGEELRLDLDEHPVHRRALDSAKPLTIHLADPEITPSEHASLEAQGYRRMLSLPLQIEGRVVGLAEVASLSTSQPFTAEEIGQSLHATLQLAPLLFQERREARQKQITEAVQALLSAAGADWCTLYICEGDTTQLVRLLDHGSGAWLEETGPELVVRDFPTLRVILGEQRVAVLRSTDEDLHPPERTLFSTVGDSALLILPLVVKTKTVGLARLYDLDPARQFSSREMALARALANQAAVALENAHLVRDLQCSLEEQRAMQSHLVRAARLSALGELSAVIAHQINNPLTTVLGDAGLLIEDIPHDDPSHESAQAILRAGKRAKRVVERVLNMARHEDDAEPRDVNFTIKEILALVGVQITESSVELEVDLAPDLPPVNAIPGQLEDLWMNLLINASDATRSKQDGQGHILVRSRLAAEGILVEVSVQDDGIGIQPENIDRIFDPLYTTKPRGKGTGLGLYICRQIVADHDGDIEVTSSPDEGTTVTVRLPVASPDTKDQPWPIS
jgi:signal transduction histidine kinase